MVICLKFFQQPGNFASNLPLPYYLEQESSRKCQQKNTLFNIKCEFFLVQHWTYMPLENAIITSTYISILWHLCLLNSEGIQESEISEKLGLANKKFSMTPNLKSVCLIVQIE